MHCGIPNCPKSTQVMSDVYLLNSTWVEQVQFQEMRTWQLVNLELGRDQWHFARARGTRSSHVEQRPVWLASELP